MKTYSIGIIDDQSLFSEGLRELLMTLDFIALAEVCNIPTEEGFKSPRKNFDLILLDVLMPHVNGFDVFQIIKKKYPNQKIAFLSVQQDLLSLKKSKKANANGYLFKNYKKEQLTNILKKILIENENYFASSPLDQEVNFRLENGKAVKITVRELEFLELFIQELTTKEIAYEMSLSPHTIVGYRKTLFDKFEVNNMIGLAKYAFRILKSYYH